MKWGMPPTIETKNLTKGGRWKPPPNLAETVRSLRDELQSCKDGNERLVKAKVKQK